MGTSSTKTKRSLRPSARSRARYHHGNLRAALIDATERLIEESGVENVSVREAAKRVGVSSGAPFRHFPTRTALLTAVAEQATRRLRDEIENALAHAPADADPLMRFRALGTAYMRWVTNNPTQFAVVSSRSLIDYDNSPSLRIDNDHMRALMDGLLEDAHDQGLLGPSDTNTVAFAARAIAYGVARMFVDGHFAQWKIEDGDPQRSFEAVFDLFIAGMRASSNAAQI